MRGRREDRTVLRRGNRRPSGIVQDMTTTRRRARAVHGAATPAKVPLLPWRGTATRPFPGGGWAASRWWRHLYCWGSESCCGCPSPSSSRSSSPPGSSTPARSRSRTAPSRRDRPAVAGARRSGGADRPSQSWNGPLGRGPRRDGALRPDVPRRCGPSRLPARRPAGRGGRSRYSAPHSPSRRQRSSPGRPSSPRPSPGRRPGRRQGWLPAGPVREPPSHREVRPPPGPAARPRCCPADWGDGTGALGPGADRTGLVERRDHGPPASEHGHGENSHRPPAVQTGRPRPRPVGDHGIRIGSRVTL